MAIVENPEIGKTRGNVGNVVFSSQYGKNILRTKPISCKNPKTPLMLKYRERHKKTLALVRQVLNYINVAYAGSVQGMAAYHRVMSINLKTCFITDTTDIDPCKFVLCDNDGSFVKNVVLKSTVSNTINGTFDSHAQNAEEGEDPVKAYGFYVGGNKIWQFDQTAIRSTGTITLSKHDITGLNIAVYFECLDRINLLMEKPKHVIKYVGTVAVL
jgi:hypothetical protein